MEQEILFIFAWGGYDAVWFDFDSILFNTMRFEAMEKNMITFIYLVKTDSKS